MTTPAFTQLTFRFRDDNGSETGATWRQTQGTNDTINTGSNFRLRFRLDETAARVWTNKNWNLYYSLNSAGYVAVTDTTPVRVSTSTHFTDGDDCTAQLTGGTGTFVTDNNGMKDGVGGATNSGAAGDLFELEWCLTLHAASLAQNNTIDLRVYDGSTAIGAYTLTPRLTVNIVASAVEETRTETRILSDSAVAQLEGGAADSETRILNLDVAAGQIYEETLYDFG
jgi:hypothetical protein